MAEMISLRSSGIAAGMRALLADASRHTGRTSWKFSVSVGKPGSSTGASGRECLTNIFWPAVVFTPGDQTQRGEKMKKKNAAVVFGVAVAGTLLTVSMQGSAQASAPQQADASLSTQAAGEGAPVTPQAAAGARAAAAAGRAAARASVHARAAAGSVAHQASEVANNFSLFSAPAKVSADGASAAATAFDR
ncbi:hypothetical protein [Streptomyces rishiriensis]|uniref:Uncharacterized protein n=1 Tax=Streptomyces rishiriensis TaxID=68264 RepID=A0ABU0P464_STRRH|nr:hypothetical protein [Streptomyces rishiriensis]MDQ0585743.1 hypothetical protein [Streptomyces rishiriensis]